MAGKTEEHGDEKKGSDRSPDVSEQEIGENEADDDEEVEKAEQRFLPAEEMRVGGAPLPNGSVHCDLIRTSKSKMLDVF